MHALLSKGKIYFLLSIVKESYTAGNKKIHRLTDARAPICSLYSLTFSRGNSRHWEGTLQKFIDRPSPIIYLHIHIHEKEQHCLSQPFLLGFCIRFWLEIFSYSSHNHCSLTLKKRTFPGQSYNLVCMS